MRINGAFVGSYADLRIFPDSRVAIAIMTNTSSVGNLGYITGAVAELLLGDASDGALVMQADLWFTHRRWEQAATAYRQLVDRNDADARSWLRLGTALMRLERIDEATDALRRAAQDPRFRAEAQRLLP